MNTLIRICFAWHFLKFAFTCIRRFWRYDKPALLAEATMKNAAGFLYLLGTEQERIDQQVHDKAGAVLAELERRDRLTNPGKYRECATDSA
jgi:hypothetical protein